jgi:hypothetical protein
MAVVTTAVLSVVIWLLGGSADAATPIMLPVEVFGADGTVRETTVSAPTGGGATKLWMQIHGANYQDKISVQVNNGSWTSLNNKTPGLNIQEPGKGYGGIGGGFQTLKMSLDLAPGAAVNGDNIIRFRFNKTNGRSSGFRVLAFNLLDAGGKKLIADSAFVQDDPNAWQPPRNTPADIAKGKELWLSAGLVERPGGRAIVARCASCHVDGKDSGYDLKYFNYSNLSIIERAKFHGLSQEQGEQIASYIRSLNVPNPGRPWNPPYQPGPGLDAKPVSEWAAGAGLEWALDSDKAVAQYMQGKGVDKNTFIDGNRRFTTFNFRETPKAMQFLDWNHWLPAVHPADAIGADAFANHNANKQYLELRRGLSGQKGASAEDYIRGPMRGDMDKWKNYVNGDDNRDFPTIGQSTGGCDTQEKCNNTYAAMLWSGVKLFELMHEFRLEERGEQFYGLQGENRTWYSNRMVFNFAPHIIGSDRNKLRVVMDETHDYRQDFDYITDVWYEMQTLLNAGARSSYKGGHHDVDWKYNWYFGQQGNDRYEPLQGLALSWKSMQELDSGLGPEGPDKNPNHNSWWGFSLRDGRPEMGHVTEGDWPDHSPAERRDLLRPLFAAWIEKLSTFTVDQWAKASMNEFNKPVDYTWGRDNPDESYPDAMRRSIIFLKDKAQMDAAVVNGYADLGKYLYPRNDWDGLKLPVNNAIPAPSGVQAATGAGQVKVSWAAVSGATSYNVKRSESADGVYRTVGMQVQGTSFTDSLLTPGKTYYYKVSANRDCDVSPDSANAVTAAAGTGLVLHWRFDEASGAQLADLSATGAWGKLIGAQREAGRVGAGLTLDGKNGFASSSQNLAQWIGGDSTVTAWVKTSATGSNDHWRTRGLMGSIADPSESAELLVGALDGSGRIGAKFWDGGMVKSGAPINDGKWHHVAFTRSQSNGEVKIYVDGQPAGSGTSGAGKRIARFFSVGRIDRMRSEPWPQSDHYWPGSLDEVRIYNKALSAVEVQQVYGDTNAPATTPTSVSNTPTATAPIATATATSAPSATATALAAPSATATPTSTGVSNTPTATSAPSVTATAPVATATATAPVGGTPAIASLTLINADTNRAIGALANGATLDLDKLPTRNLSIRANTNPARVGSVRFDLDNGAKVQIENTPPYAIAGDANGDYMAWTPSVGNHTLTLTAYTGKKGTGTAGAALSITFTVVDGGQ